jgi:gluconokinase
MAAIQLGSRHPATKASISVSADFLILMGVAGSGKTTLGLALAERLGWIAIDADDHHSERNRQKMAQGMPLTDEDRASWLAELVTCLRAELARGRSVVLNCSALKRSYRDVFRQAFPGARFVYLQISESTAIARVSGRAAHLFPASLVASQFATLESPVGEDGVLTVDGTLPLPQLCARIAEWAGTSPGPATSG